MQIINTMESEEIYDKRSNNQAEDLIIQKIGCSTNLSNRIIEVYRPFDPFEKVRDTKSIDLCHKYIKIEPQDCKEGNIIIITVVLGEKFEYTQKMIDIVIKITKSTTLIKTSSKVNISFLSLDDEYSILYMINPKNNEMIMKIEGQVKYSEIKYRYEYIEQYCVHQSYDVQEKYNYKFKIYKFYPVIAIGREIIKYGHLLKKTPQTQMENLLNPDRNYSHIIRIGGSPCRVEMNNRIIFSGQMQIADYIKKHGEDQEFYIILEKEMPLGLFVPSVFQLILRSCCFVGKFQKKVCSCVFIHFIGMNNKTGESTLIHSQYMNLKQDFMLKLNSHKMGYNILITEGIVINRRIGPPIEQQIKKINQILERLLFFYDFPSDLFHYYKSVLLKILLSNLSIEKKEKEVGEMLEWFIIQMEEIRIMLHDHPEDRTKEKQESCEIAKKEISLMLRDDKIYDQWITLEGKLYPITVREESEALRQSKQEKMARNLILDILDSILL